MKVSWSVLWQKDLPVFAVLVAISVAIAAAGTLSGAGPVSRLLGHVFLPFEALSAKISSLALVYDENRLLRSKLAAASRENASLREQVYEIERLRRLVDFAATYPAEVRAARVIAEVDERLGGGIVIDRGYDAGLARNMTVVSPDGLVGLVVRVGEGVATVKRMVDPGSRVSARLQTTRVAGILRARGDRRVFMDWVAPDARVEPGDSVVSSGLGSVVPPGIPIGTVRSVEADLERFSLSLEVAPFVDFDRLEEVFVVVSRPSALGVKPEDIGSPEVER
ncbi:MAG: rod shape-determining protein MreC [bacterium]